MLTRTSWLPLSTDGIGWCSREPWTECGQTGEDLLHPSVPHSRFALLLSGPVLSPDAQGCCVAFVFQFDLAAPFTALSTSITPHSLLTMTNDRAVAQAHRRDRCSKPVQVIWYLWWTAALGQISSECFGVACYCSTVIITYLPGLVLYNRPVNGRSNSGLGSTPAPKINRQ
jgi:hypothetical protein